MIVRLHCPCLNVPGNVVYAIALQENSEPCVADKVGTS